MKREELLEMFTYHRPGAGQVERMKDLRECALEFALLIDESVPDGPDKSAAIRKLRECVMTANAAIVLEKET